jgi:hypothetical protein
MMWSYVDNNLANGPFGSLELEYLSGIFEHAYSTTPSTLLYDHVIVRLQTGGCFGGQYGQQERVT